MLKIIFPYSLIMGGVGLIESLLTLNVVDEIAGNKLHLRHLSDDCKQLLKNAESVIEVNIMEDPYYRVAIDTN